MAEEIERLVDMYGASERAAITAAYEAGRSHGAAREAKVADVDPAEQAERAVDAAHHRSTLLYVQTCAASWDPDARLVGNVKAGDIVMAVQWAIDGAAREAELRKQLEEVTKETWQLGAELEETQQKLTEATSRAEKSEAERDELDDRLQFERQDHDVTRGYRHQAEVDRDEAKRLLAETCGRIHRLADNGGATEEQLRDLDQELSGEIACLGLGLEEQPDSERNGGAGG